MRNTKTGYSGTQNRTGIVSPYLSPLVICSLIYCLLFSPFLLLYVLF